MLTLLFTVAHGLAHGPALPLDKITVGDAASLHGQVVRVTCPAGQPPYTFAGWTVTGVEVGGVEMGVQFYGQVDINQGETVTALGVLRVVKTPAAVVNGQFVPAATSVVVVGVRVRCPLTWEDQ